MASVNMSQTLREQICDNYLKSLKVAMYKDTQIMDGVNTVIETCTKNDLEFARVLKMNEEYIELAKKLNAKYPGYNSYNYAFKEEIVSPETSLGLVCNPNRPTKDHFTYVQDWAAPYKYKGYNDKTDTLEKGRNFVEGDVAVRLKNLPEFYTPVPTEMDYEQWRAQGYSPHSSRVLVLTDPNLCNLFSPIGQVEKDIKTTLDTFKQWLETVTTLKKFLDQIPNGLDLVPEEYKERLQKRNPTKSANTPLPQAAMPESLKKQLEEVILENKLLGN